MNRKIFLIGLMLMGYPTLGMGAETPSKLSVPMIKDDVAAAIVSGDFEKAKNSFEKAIRSGEDKTLISGPVFSIIMEGLDIFRYLPFPDEVLTDEGALNEDYRKNLTELVSNRPEQLKMVFKAMYVFYRNNKYFSLGEMEKAFELFKEKCSENIKRAERTPGAKASSEPSTRRPGGKKPIQTGKKPQRKRSRKAEGPKGLPSGGDELVKAVSSKTASTFPPGLMTPNVSVGSPKDYSPNTVTPGPRGRFKVFGKEEEPSSTPLRAKRPGMQVEKRADSSLNAKLSFAAKEEDIDQEAMTTADGE